MEIFIEIITYFGIPAISEAETFPELLEYFLTTGFSLILIITVMRALIGATHKINDRLSR